MVVDVVMSSLSPPTGSFTYFCTFIVVIVVYVVTPSVSCGRFDLRCTKIRKERIHLGTPPFNEDALKMKQKVAHTPDSVASSFAENDVEHITLYQTCLFTHTKYLYSGNDSGRKGAHFDLALDKWTAANLAKKEFFARQNKMAEASQAEKKQNSIAACIQCLATMDEITPDQYVKACESFRDCTQCEMDPRNSTNLFDMDAAINSQSNEFPNYDNITAEMDSSGESLEIEDSADSEDNLDSADIEDSEDSIAAQLRSSFIASDDDAWTQPQRTCLYTGEMYTQHLLNGHPRTIREVLRMDAPTFRSLCDELKRREFVKVDKNRLSIEQSLAILLYVCGHSERHRLAADRFQHSTETIHRHFKIMIRALCRLAVLIIRPLDLNVIPPEIRNNPKRYPWFKDCIGAIDGTHIAEHALASKRTAYRGRKVALTQNVLATCSFDLKFTFVYPGWEGSAIDSRVLSDALTRPDVSFSLPLTGKYYLVDAGFTNMTGFLAPYRSESYHLDQFRGCRHVQMACCACHNWIRVHSANDPWFNRRGNARAGQAAPATPAAGISNEADEVMNEMVQLRDEIAIAMWNNHRVHP
ncbi:unnamed protein product [Camellia sinensis]